MIRKIGFSLLALVLIGTAVFLAGPRVDLAYHPRGAALPADLDAYLHREEKRFPALAPGAEKTIVWARADQAKTDLAIVYLHGFSATRQETAPLCDQVAARLGANLFYTRLTGHGLDGEALARASVDDWLNDADEALRIGERLGNKVLLVGCSTGGALAAWLAATADNRHVLGYVMISANFAPQDPKAQLLTWPWARQLIPLLVGKNRQSTPISAQHARYWNTRYPTVALLPMMGVCQLAEAMDFRRIDRPLLMVYSPRDEVVDVAAIKRAYSRWPDAPHKELVPFDTGASHETHVIAGDIRAPGGTKPMADLIVHFVERIR